MIGRGPVPSVFPGRPGVVTVSPGTFETSLDVRAPVRSFLRVMNSGSGGGGAGRLNTGLNEGDGDGDGLRIPTGSGGIFAEVDWQAGTPMTAHIPANKPPPIPISTVLRDPPDIYCISPEIRGKGGKPALSPLPHFVFPAIRLPSGAPASPPADVVRAARAQGVSSSCGSGETAWIPPLPRDESRCRSASGGGRPFLGPRP